MSLGQLDIYEVFEIYFFIRKLVEKIELNLIEILTVKEEKQTSIFDAYDIEKGYIEEEEEEKVDEYVAIMNLVNSLIKYSIDVLKNSYKDTLEIDIDYFIDYLKYDLEKREEEQGEQETESY